MAELISNKGEELDLLVRQGATFGPFKLIVKNPDGSPVNLAESMFRAQIRKSFDSAQVAATFTCVNSDPLNGEVTITLDAAQSAMLEAGVDEDDEASKYLWDLEAEEAGGRVLPYLYGKVRVFREITKL
jgi:hypothetical protein